MKNMNEITNNGNVITKCGNTHIFVKSVEIYLQTKNIQLTLLQRKDRIKK